MGAGRRQVFFSLVQLLHEAEKKTAPFGAVSSKSGVRRPKTQDDTRDVIVNLRASDRKRPQKGVRMAVQSAAAGEQDIPGNGVGPSIPV